MLHKPLRDNVTLCLPTNTPNPSPTPYNPENNDILTCYKEHCIATRLSIKHANRSRYNKYGGALLQMFVRKPRDALKSNKKPLQMTENTNSTRRQQTSRPSEALSQEESSATPRKSKE